VEKPDGDDALLDLGVEIGLLTKDQAAATQERRKQLARGGIKLPVGQTLIERRFISPGQLKTLSDEVEKRRIKAGATPSKQKIEPTPIKQFGQYELLQVLSEKGHSRVFKARDTAMNRMVVLKVLPKTASADRQWSERFKREIQLAGRLSHPNIVTAYGAGEVDGCALMAFEYIQGVSLEDRLEREGNLPERTAWLITREIAKGLAYAAANDILHRDIKPENILCSIDGKVKIIDMGFSKSLADDSTLTAAGTTVGTPFYISPEQAKGTRDLDARVDLYSLGCTTYHMLTGSVPFFGEQVTEVMLKHTQAPRPDPRETLPEISEETAKLVMRMIAINPNDRPGSAAELVTMIDAMLEKLPEPEEHIRPVQKITPSNDGNALPVGKGSKVSVQVSQRGSAVEPAAKPGFFGWLRRLFG
jgi:serine/threonine protein kinase